MHRKILSICYLSVKTSTIKMGNIIQGFSPFRKVKTQWKKDLSACSVTVLVYLFFYVAKLWSHIVTWGVSLNGFLQRGWTYILVPPQWTDKNILFFFTQPKIWAIVFFKCPQARYEGKFFFLNRKKTYINIWWIGDTWGRFPIHTVSALPYKK